MWSFTFVLFLFVLKISEAITTKRAILDGRNITVYFNAEDTDQYNNIFLYARRLSDISPDTKETMEGMIKDLHSLVVRAFTDVITWIKDNEEQAEFLKSEVVSDINKLKRVIRDSQSDVQAWLYDTSEVVSKCVKMRESEAQVSFNEAVQDIERCIDNESNKTLDLLRTLHDKSTTVLRAAETVFSEMGLCNEDTKDDIPINERCLSKVLLKNKQMVILIGEVGLLIGRTGFAVLNFPNEVDRCVTYPLVEAGTKMGTMLIDITECYLNSAVGDSSDVDLNFN